MLGRMKLRYGRAVPALLNDCLERERVYEACYWHLQLVSLMRPGGLALKLVDVLPEGEGFAALAAVVCLGQAVQSALEKPRNGGVSRPSCWKGPCRSHLPDVGT